MQLAALVAGAAATMPTNPSNITVYHVNQANYSGITNMNTADGAGDAFFDFRFLLEQQKCANKTAHTFPGECTNPEMIAHDLVITKVVVAIADSRYSDYGECNVCINGTVPMTNPPRACVDGTYHCRCGDWGSTNDVCSNPAVGKQNVKAMMNGFARHMLPGSGPPMHWMVNLVERVGGEWYSSLDIGECDNKASKTCAWKLLETVKEVNATCQAANARKTIENLPGAQKCFAACPSGSTTSLCYTNCYYSALLGDDASVAVPSTGGVPGPKITKIWEDAFEACPARKPAGHNSLPASHSTATKAMGAGAVPDA